MQFVTAALLLGGCREGFGYAESGECNKEEEPKECRVLDPNNFGNEVALTSKECDQLCTKQTSCKSDGLSGWVWVSLRDDDPGDDQNWVVDSMSCWRGRR